MHEKDKRDLINRSERKQYALEILWEARTAFEDRRDYFKRRRRSFRYYIGNQWGDKMEHPDTGETMTEDSYIRSQGRIPAQNNQIGTIIRNMIGQFRSNYADPVVFARARSKQEATEMMTAALQAVLDVNEAQELDARNMEEFMISAATGWKINYKWMESLNREDAFMENIDQTRFFHNMNVSDPRLHDLNMVGEIHDMRMDEILAAFAKKPGDEERIKRMFPSRAALESQANHYPDYLQDYKDFYIPEEEDMHRVIEVWKKEYDWQQFVHDPSQGKYEVAGYDYFSRLGFADEEIESYTAQELVQLYNQMMVDNAINQGVDPQVVPLLELDSKYEGVWKVYFLTPLAEILFEADTPYEHEGHPYIFGLYPLLDGKTRSLVESVIDQQRHINRLISLMDHNIGTGSKNPMWIPVDLIPEDMSRKQFANQEIELNGKVFYKPKHGIPLPQVIKNNSNVAGAQELLVLQMNLLKEISAVNEAIQGIEPKSGTPASLYAQQAQNASISNKDIFDFYFGLIRKRNRRLVQVIQQFYKDERYIRIAGTGINKDIEHYYDPNEVQDIDFDVVIGETQNTLAYRQLVDTYLKEFLDAQLITFEEYLRNSSLPFADKLLQTISNRQQGQMGEGAGGIPPEMVDQIAGGNITPEAQQMLGLQQQQFN